MKMQFLLDARSSEPLSICFASDMTAWEQCRRGGGWSISLDSLPEGKELPGEENTNFSTKSVIPRGYNIGKKIPAESPSKSKIKKFLKNAVGAVRLLLA